MHRLTKRESLGEVLITTCRGLAGEGSRLHLQMKHASNFTYTIDLKSLRGVFSRNKNWFSFQSKCVYLFFAHLIWGHFLQLICVALWSLLFLSLISPLPPHQQNNVISDSCLAY